MKETPVTQLFVTVGTSIFTNLLDWAADTRHDEAGELRMALESCRNTPAREQKKKNTYEAQLFRVVKFAFLPRGQKEVRSRKERGSQQVLRTSRWTNRPADTNGRFQNIQASAEIQSTLKLLTDPKWQGTRFRLHLIATDTQLSLLASELVGDYFSGHPQITDIQVKLIKKLQIRDPNDFSETGLDQLIGYLIRILQNGNKNTKKLLPGLLNVTGGYKGIVPILSTAGQLLRLPIVYQHEDSEALIQVPSLPFHFDWTFMELYRFYFNQARVQKVYLPGLPVERRRVLPADEIESEAEYQVFKEKVLDLQLMRPWSDPNKTESHKEKVGPDGYMLTYLGKLLHLHIEANFAHASTTYGSSIEFLFYECLVNEPLSWKGVTYHWVEHSVKFPTYDEYKHKEVKREIDLVLYPKREDREPVILAEIKSFAALRFNEDHNNFRFEKQFRKHIAAIRRGDIPTPAMYLLLLYGYKDVNKWEYLKASFKKMWSTLKTMGIGGLQVWGVDLEVSVPDTSNNPNIYSALLQQKLSREKKQVDAAEKERGKFWSEYLHLYPLDTYPK